MHMWGGVGLALPEENVVVGVVIVQVSPGVQGMAAAAAAMVMVLGTVTKPQAVLYDRRGGERTRCSGEL